MSTSLRLLLCRRILRNLVPSSKSPTDFYNSPAVAHRRWDSRMSAASALDLSCELLERLAGPENVIPPALSRESSLVRWTSHLELGESSLSPSLSPSRPSQAQASPSLSPSRQASLSAPTPQPRRRSSRRAHEHSVPEKPVLFVIGDAKFSHTRKGLQTSKHGRLFASLVDRLKKRYPDSLCVGIDEYMTSQHCPRCLGKLKYMRRKPRDRELKHKTKGKDGLIDDLCVQYCEGYVPFHMF